MGGDRWLALGLIVGASQAGSGCYHTVSIRPDQLPRLSSVNEVQVGSTMQTTDGTSTAGQVVPTTQSAPVTDGSNRHVIASDGTIVDVEGDFDATVFTVSGEPRAFAHPVVATVTPDGMLEVRGGNGGPSRVPLQDVARVDVEWYDAMGTVLALSLGGVAAVAFIAVVIFAALGP